MKRLIICDTLYQIMLAVQMKITLFKNDQVTLWISDHSNRAKEIADNVNTLNLFQNTIFIETKRITYSLHKIEKIKNVIEYGFGSKTAANVDDYDEVIFHGPSLFVYGISAIYRRRNHHTIWSRYEEGILSYDTDFPGNGSEKLIEGCLKILRKPVVRDEIRNYYCVYPKLKKEHREWNLITIPSFDLNYKEVSAAIISAFQYKPSDIKQKYIFFASSSDIDGKPYGETDLVLRLAEFVGKENLLVKVHPRDTRGVYEKNGICIMRADGIPWDVFQLCSNMEDKILLTVDSGSFLSISAIMHSTVKSYFLFDILRRGEQFSKREETIRDVLNELQSLGTCSNIKIIDDLKMIQV